MSSQLIKTLSASSFAADVLQSPVPVLVDFWAEWCGPCKAIAPALDELSVQYQGRLQIAKLNVDEHGQIAAQYGVRGIPALMIFKNGQLVGTKMGAEPKGKIAAFIDSHL